jgi:hypothetical protein
MGGMTRPVSADCIFKQHFKLRSKSVPTMRPGDRSVPFFE